MRLAIDSGKLLYVLGVLFAAAALLYFVRDVVFDLSITVKAALLLLGFVAFVVGGVALEQDVLDVVAFALAGVTYVVFVGYVVVRYRPGETGTFLLLAASAALFVGLGYALRRGLPSLSRRPAAYALGALVVVSVLLVGVDAATGGVQYAVQTNESVTVAVPAGEHPGGEYVHVTRRIGSITATNPSPFTRALSLPEVSGCLVGTTPTAREDLWVSTDIEWDEDTIGGSATRSYALTGEFTLDANRTKPTTYAVERDIGCAAERSEPTIAITVGERDQLD